MPATLWQARSGGLLSPRFVLVVGLAVGLHVALLMPMRFSVSRGPSVVAAPAVSVRMLPAAPATQAHARPPDVLATQAAPSPAPPTPPQPSPPEPLPAAPVPPAPKVLTADGAGAARPPPKEAEAPRAAAPTTPVPPSTAASAAPAASVTPTGLPPAPNYLVGGKLDPGPRPLHDIEPVYPARAGQQQGVVVLRLLINEQGVVDNAAVVRAAPPGYFEASAIEAFSAARFSPGLLLGVAVKSQVTIEVEFMPINRGAAVSGRTY